MILRFIRMVCRLSTVSVIVLGAAGLLSVCFPISGQWSFNRFLWSFASAAGDVHLRVVDQGPVPLPGDISPDEDPAAAVFEQARLEVVVNSFPRNMTFGIERDDGVIGFFTPYWIWVVFFSIAPLTRHAWVSLRERRRKRLRKLGLCPNCRYDLRMSTGRCPECGCDDAAASQSL